MELCGLRNFYPPYRRIHEDHYFSGSGATMTLEPRTVRLTGTEKAIAESTSTGS